MNPNIVSVYDAFANDRNTAVSLHFFSGVVGIDLASRARLVLSSGGRSYFLEVWPAEKCATPSYRKNFRAMDEDEAIVKANAILAKYMAEELCAA